MQQPEFDPAVNQLAQQFKDMMSARFKELGRDDLDLTSFLLGAHSFMDALSNPPAPQRIQNQEECRDINLETIKQQSALIEQLESQLAARCTMGVGDGSGNLFVHGDHISIKAVQSKLLELESLRALCAELEAKAQGVPEWRRLLDSQWVNIVNDPGVLGAADKESAVDLAVKLTEARLKANNAAAPSPAVPAHPDDAAVDVLAAKMKAKLAKQRGKGYGGWDTDCTQQRLSGMLRAHVAKGDPVDVANFCAFLNARGEGIATAVHTPAVPVGMALVPKRVTVEMQLVMGEDGWLWEDVLAAACAISEAEYEELSAAPAEAVPAPDARESIGTLWVEESGANDLELCPVAAPKLPPGEYALFAIAAQAKGAQA